MVIEGETITEGFPVVDQEFDFVGTCLGMLPHRCTLLRPTVEGEDSGGAGIESFEMLSAKQPCQFYAKSIRGKEVIKDREAGVGVYNMTFPKAIPVTERWRVSNVTDLDGQVLPGVGAETFEIIGPPTPWNEFGIMAVPIRVTR